MKRVIMFVFLLIGAVFIVGCACEPLSLKGVNFLEAQEMCKDDKNLDHCYKNLAKDALNPKLCELILKEGTQGKCLIEVALMLNDPGICSSVGGYYTEEQCYYELALEMKDASLCNNIPDAYEHGGDDISGVFTKENCMNKATGKTKAKLCGMTGGPCCAAYVCQDIGCSITYRCEACGKENLPCCLSDINLRGCEDNLICSDKGVCGRW